MSALTGLDGSLFTDEAQVLVLQHQGPNPTKTNRSTAVLCLKLPRTPEILGL